MALQDILNRILEEAKAEVETIKSDLAAQVKTLSDESKKIAKAEQAELDAKTKAALEQAESKIESMARRENSMDLLTAKQAIIESALETFLQSLENADDKTYGAVLQKLFDRIQATSGKILAPPKRLEITSKVAPQGFTVVPHKDLMSGFIYHSGNAEVDHSFRTLIYDEFRNDLISYFSDQLKLLS